MAALISVIMVQPKIGERRLALSLDSLARQAGAQNIEVLIVSPQSTDIILEKYRDTFSSVRVLSGQKNLAAAINIAAGNLILLLTANYYPRNNCLSAMAQFLAENNCDGVAFGQRYNLWRNNLEIKNVNYYEYVDMVIPRESLAVKREPAAYLKGSGCALFSPSLLKKEILLKIIADLSVPNYELLAQTFLESGYKAMIYKDASVNNILGFDYLSQPNCSLASRLKSYLVTLIKSTSYLRDMAIRIKYVANNLYQLFTERTKRKAYYQNIQQIILKKNWCLS